LVAAQYIGGYQRAAKMGGRRHHSASGGFERAADARDDAQFRLRRLSRGSDLASNGNPRGVHRGTEHQIPPL